MEFNSISYIEHSCLFSSLCHTELTRDKLLLLLLFLVLKMKKRWRGTLLLSNPTSLLASGEIELVELGKARVLV